MWGCYVDLKPSRDVSAGLTPKNLTRLPRKSQKRSSRPAGLAFYTLAWRTYDPLETRRAAGCYELADSFRRHIILFALKQWNVPLFGTLMGLAVLLTGAVLLNRYLRNRTVAVNEAVLVGMLWLVLSLAFDYPMFGYGPMKMTACTYYSEIGLGYLMLPAFAFGAARLAQP